MAIDKPPPTVPADRPVPEPAPSPALTPPPGNPRFPLFDSLRGVAVLFVLFFHCSIYTGRVGLGPLGRVAEVGGSEGVIVFFVISGFLLYRPFAAARAAGARRPSVSRYARRRSLRILPGYWVALTVLAIIPGLSDVFTGEWWRYYGFLMVYWTHSRNSGLRVAWSLCDEVAFYIALPVWALLLRRRFASRSGAGFLRTELGCLAVPFLGGLMVQLAVARWLWPYALSISIVGQCCWLALGMALAVASVALQRDPGALPLLRRLADQPEACWLAALLAVVGLAALVPSQGFFGLAASTALAQSLPRTAAKLALEGIFAATFVLPAVFDRHPGRIVHRVLESRPLLALGVISYSMYLYHLPIVGFLAAGHMAGATVTGLDLRAHLHFAPTTIICLLSLALSIGAAAISYRFVELPFLRRKEPARPRP
jgi:peptidoglycan/LPS O-acetylase OafA/YrhL